SQYSITCRRGVGQATIQTDCETLLEPEGVKRLGQSARMRHTLQNRGARLPNECVAVLKHRHLKRTRRDRLPLRQHRSGTPPRRSEALALSSWTSIVHSSIAP